MPIEIRELIIKTEIRTVDSVARPLINEHDLNLLKEQLLESCRSLLLEGTKKNNYQR